MTVRYGLVTLGFALCLTGIAAAQGPPPLPPPLPPPPPASPGQPRDSSATQKTGTAKLAGRVVALDTGRPLRRAVVRASGPELREGKSVSTDADGRWELRELPAGRLTIQVSKGGYVSLSYGQRRPFEAGKPIDVANGATIDKIDVALPRGGAVTGRVVDEFGEAVTGAGVTAMRFRYMNGQRQLAQSASDTTDDLGQYRLHGLPPGDYYVAARPSSFTFLGTSEDRSGYGQSFYPGALNVSEAQRLQVAVGQEAQNIVISLVPSRLSNISGTVTSASGKPVKQGMVMLREEGPIGNFSVRPGMIADGSWKINGVSPGDYVLVAQVVDLEAMDAIAATGTNRGMPTPEMVTSQITVTGEDVTGITLITSLGGTARGVVRFDGGAPPATPPSMMSVIAADMSSTALPMSSNATVKADWTFELKGLVGRRVMRAINLPSGWAVKSIMVDGADIIDSGLEVKTGQEISNVEVVLTNQVTEVSGSVQNAKGGAEPDFAVILFPTDAQFWGWQSRHVRVARPDQTGRFVISGLPAGSYHAVALEYLEPGEETNPEFLERVKTLATSLRLNEGEKKPITLKLSAQ